MSSCADPALATAETDLAKRAAAAVEAIVETGAALLVAEPWRASRIVRGAESLSFEALRNEVARRQALPPPADFNRALALAQLARALDHEAFAAAWMRSTRRAGDFGRLEAIGVSKQGE
ncbi:MAG TPA: hypothetical protein VKV96_17285, partial [Roseiarcus sp.]|nr:hypothetical protein [Roseiarcus sp.]